MAAGANQPAMDGWAGNELAPGKDAKTDDEIADCLRKTHNTVYHPACTAKMGDDDADDPMAVLDARLRVRGVDGLRVADSSAMPFLVAVNPCITTMAIGENAPT
jgi:choline oxidase